MGRRKTGVDSPAQGVGVNGRDAGVHRTDQKCWARPSCISQLDPRAWMQWRLRGCKHSLPSMALPSVTRPCYSSPARLNAWPSRAERTDVRIQRWQPKIRRCLSMFHIRQRKSACALDNLSCSRYFATRRRLICKCSVARSEGARPRSAVWSDRAL